jgi:hypothetical protein
MLLAIGKSLKEIQHPVDAVSGFLSRGEVAVTQNIMTCTTVLGVQSIPKTRGFFEPVVQKAVIASISDRAYYCERRNVNSSSPVFIKKLPMTIFSPIPDIINGKMREFQNHAYRIQLFYSFNERKANAMIYEGRLCKYFRPECSMDSGNAKNLGLAEHKMLIPFNTPVPKITTQITVSDAWDVIETHKAYRGYGKSGNGTVAAGFYFFSAPRAVVKCVQSVADVVSLCMHKEFVAVAVSAIQKRYNIHWALSVQANGILVGSEQKRGRKIDGDKIYPVSMFSKMNYITILDLELWKSPNVMTSSNASTKIYAVKRDQDVMDKITEIMEERKPVMVEVFICIELEKYVNFLFPSSRGHEGLVWLTNQDVKIFTCFEHVVRRSMFMALACTTYPFSSHNYSDVDEYAPALYRQTMHLRWYNSKTLNEPCSKEYEMEVKALDEPILPSLMEMHKTHVIVSQPENKKEAVKTEQAKFEEVKKKAKEAETQIETSEMALITSPDDNKYADIELNFDIQNIQAQNDKMVQSFGAALTQT